MESGVDSPCFFFNEGRFLEFSSEVQLKPYGLMALR